ncbi:IclR family transcriptional regulator [Sphingopyxis sp. PET50]|uniref:IclR family transcriptional regulator n=1 Tax=Sphingopyxis sp. PET50 TaxID=2976533 RepID=UPI0021AF65FB|nr:IclR family transcriptional regulator [Sphingopyxis sp. PET50]
MPRNSNGAEDLAGPKQLVGSIVHAVAVLRYLSETDEPLGVTAIAKALQISPSSCYNIVRTLVSEGLLEFDSRRKTYSIGLGTVELASRALSRNDIFPFVRQRLERIANEHELTAILWRVSHGRRLVVVGVVECNADMQIAVKVGYRVPLLSGGVGRCIAAFSKMPESEMRTEFERVRNQNTIGFEDYVRDLEAVRTNGWAIDRGTFKSGVISVASPIFDERGAISLCISGVMLAGNQSAAALDRIGMNFRDLAESVTRRSF